MFFLEVRPFNEEFVAAQSQASARPGPAISSSRLLIAGAEGDHQRDLEHRAPLGRRTFGGRHQGDRAGAGGAEGAGGARRSGRRVAAAAAFLPQQIARAAAAAVGRESDRGRRGSHDEGDRAARVRPNTRCDHPRDGRAQRPDAGAGGSPAARDRAAAEQQCRRPRQQPPGAGPLGAVRQGAAAAAAHQLRAALADRGTAGAAQDNQDAADRIRDLARRAGGHQRASA